MEQLNRRLGTAVGGDNVANRGRILRLSGFINLNHPGAQRARLLEFHPDRRYTLDELDQRLPQLPQTPPEECGVQRPTARGQNQPSPWRGNGPITFEVFLENAFDFGEHERGTTFLCRS